MPFVRTELPETVDAEKMLELIRTRITSFGEIEDKIRFFIVLPDYNTELFQSKKYGITFSIAEDLLTIARPVLNKIKKWKNGMIYDALRGLCGEAGIVPGAMLWCLRIAVSGMEVTPGGATEIMEVIGREESLRRIEIAMTKLRACQ